MAGLALFLMNWKFPCSIVVIVKGCVLHVSDADTLNVYILYHLVSSVALLGQF